MSDAVKVTGFYNKTPKVQFMYRVNRTINLAEEKTTEKALQICVEKTAKEMGIDIADFSVYPNTDVTPNRYDFLIEPMREVTEFDMDALRESIFKNGLVIEIPAMMQCKKLLANKKSNPSEILKWSKQYASYGYTTIFEAMSSDMHS